MIDALMELERRIKELDAVLGSRQIKMDVCTDLIQFLHVLERITSTGTPMAVGNFLCKSAKDADAIQKKSRLLARLEKVVPEIVSGTLRRNFQYWVGTRNLDLMRSGEPILSEKQFIDVAAAHDIKASTKPFYLGLFTSTGVLGSYGMWRMYLESGGESTLFPRPWNTWAVKPYDNVTVYEISSAKDWVTFVLSYPKLEHGLLYPDWKSVAQHFDAIHITLRAIVAIQGLHFSTQKHIIGPSYWHMESTFWLRWCFQSTSLVEKVI